jgi:hypothetical protein
MGEPYTLPPVSGPKETISTLLDNTIYPSRFANLDQASLRRRQKKIFRFLFASFSVSIDVEFRVLSFDAFER